MSRKHLKAAERPDFRTDGGLRARVSNEQLNWQEMTRPEAAVKGAIAALISRLGAMEAHALGMFGAVTAGMGAAGCRAGGHRLRA